MSHGKLFRDDKGRVVRLVQHFPGSGYEYELLRVDQYAGSSRKALSITIDEGLYRLERTTDGTWLLTQLRSFSPSAPVPEPVAVNDVRLNQRTGMLTYKHPTEGAREVSLRKRISTQDQGVEAFYIFVCLLVPPLWPVLIYLLMRMYARETLYKAQDKVSGFIDAISGAYKE